MMISLIIPVFNKAPYLKRCLASVASQKDKSAQVIIVDDGSTDGSAEICDYYEKMVGFEVYHTENHGVSEARNFGMGKAKGDFIAFLDADDMLTRDAIGIMNEATKDGYNICQFRQFRCKSFDQLNYIPYGWREGDYSFDEIPKYWVMVWNKLYKKSFLDENKIRFKKGMQFGEDALFNMQCILANGGIHQSDSITVIHCMDDHSSLCRGTLNLERVNKLDNELCKIADQQKDLAKLKWVTLAINQHRESRLYRKHGFYMNQRGRFDIVYFVKDEPVNDELVYSLRSVEENWPYRQVWFCGGKPDNLQPDRMMRIRQEGLNKWEKVRNMIRKVCENDQISDYFYLFNDDFYVLREFDEDMAAGARYNGYLIPYIERIERKTGSPDAYTIRLREAAEKLAKEGKTTYNYEVHKPMLINRKRALEVFEKYPDTPAFRSLYGNYWQIGGEDRHDMKIKVLNYPGMNLVENYWNFLSTSDKSFHEGNVGEFVRNRFNKRSRFEK